MLQNVAGDDCHFVSGEGDQGFDFPEAMTCTVGEFKVGMIHGHQVIPWGDQSAMAKYAGRLGVDILVHGHTHRGSVVEEAGRCFINPGSVTGACNAMGEFDVTPSFMLMSVTGKDVVLYTYQE